MAPSIAGLFDGHEQCFAVFGIAWTGSRTQTTAGIHHGTPWFRWSPAAWIFWNRSSPSSANATYRRTLRQLACPIVFRYRCTTQGRGLPRFLDRSDWIGFGRTWAGTAVVFQADRGALYRSAKTWITAYNQRGLTPGPAGQTTSTQWSATPAIAPTPMARLNDKVLEFRFLDFFLVLYRIKKILA